MSGLLKRGIVDSYPSPTCLLFISNSEHVFFRAFVLLADIGQAYLLRKSVLKNLNLVLCLHRCCSIVDAIPCEMMTARDSERHRNVPITRSLNGRTVEELRTFALQVGESKLGRHFTFFLPLAHIHDMVLVYSSKCSPFNLLTNCMFYLAIHALDYELKVKCT